MPNEYREQLPDQCPPEVAQEIGTDTEVFRLVQSNPVTDDDFKSQRALKPKATFRVDECVARGVSVWVSQTEADNARKLPKLRATHLCRVRLHSGAGMLMQTFKMDHRTWWPSAEFAVLDHCEVVS